MFLGTWSAQEDAFVARSKMVSNGSRIAVGTGFRLVQIVVIDGWWSVAVAAKLNVQ
jgi:hypothetical protein